VVNAVTKTEHIQIRVTRAQKRDLERRARAEGLDLSAWMLARLAPPRRAKFQELVVTLARGGDKSYVFAELGELLSGLAREEFAGVTETLPVARLDDVTLNLLAAMIELRAARLHVHPPAWTAAVEPLRDPWFPTMLSSVRLELLCNAPPPYRRRNLFVDSTFEQRV
jgi:hypothetical protein